MAPFYQPPPATDYYIGPKKYQPDWVSDTWEKVAHVQIEPGDKKLYALWSSPAGPASLSPIQDAYSRIIPLSAEFKERLGVWIEGAHIRKIQDGRWWRVNGSAQGTLPRELQPIDMQGSLKPSGEFLPGFTGQPQPGLPPTGLPPVTLPDTPADTPAVTPGATFLGGTRYERPAEAPSDWVVLGSVAVTTQGGGGYSWIWGAPGTTPQTQGFRPLSEYDPAAPADTTTPVVTGPDVDIPEQLLSNFRNEASASYQDAAAFHDGMTDYYMSLGDTRNAAEIKAQAFMDTRIPIQEVDTGGEVTPEADRPQTLEEILTEYHQGRLVLTEGRTQKEEALARIYAFYEAAGSKDPSADASAFWLGEGLTLEDAGPDPGDYIGGMYDPTAPEYDVSGIYGMTPGEQRDRFQEQSDPEGVFERTITPLMEGLETAFGPVRQSVLNRYGDIRSQYELFGMPGTFKSFIEGGKPTASALSGALGNIASLLRLDPESEESQLWDRGQALRGLFGAQEDKGQGRLQRALLQPLLANISPAARPYAVNAAYDLFRRRMSSEPGQYLTELLAPGAFYGSRRVPPAQELFDNGRGGI